MSELGIIIKNNGVIKLRDYMIREGLNQTQMACQLGISSTQISRWLRTGRMGRLWEEKLKNLGVIQ